MKFLDLKPNLDLRASAWKDQKAVAKYEIEPVEHYLETHNGLIDTTWVICKPDDWAWKNEFEPVTFSLGSANKFIKDNPLVEIEGLSFTPVKVSYKYSTDRYGIAFQMI